MRVSFLRSVILSIAVLALVAPVVAQSQGESGPPPPEATPPTPAAPTTKTTDTPIAPAGPASADPAAAAIMREVAGFTAFDRLKTQGLTTDFPGVYETITRDAGGFRTWLYEHDLYFRGLSSNTPTIDVSGRNRKRGAQQYTGQKFTYTQSNDLRMSWKIGGSGDDITQINVAGLVNFTTWRALGPSRARFTMLNLYHSFGDRAVEIKAGYGQNISEFVGIFAGGNPILANGLAASIPISTGMSGGVTNAPSLIVTLNGKGGLYSKSAVQRSQIPEGSEADASNAGLGLKFNRTGARPLFIQEVGMRRAASSDSRQVWLRAGGTYNLSRYQRRDGSGREDRNWSLYALADYQLYQPDERRSYRGIYVGASALFAPDALNVYKRSLEGRVYALGMIPGRPTDQMTFTIGRNTFSRALGGLIERTGGTANREQFSLGALYAFHASNGIFVSPSVNYIRNPTVAGNFKPALNFGTSLTLLF